MPEEPTITGIPLSLQQRFFCDLDQGDVTGAFGAKHVASSAWRLRGKVGEAALRRALDDVVERHEMLRTSFDRSGTDRRQHVHPPGPVRLLVRDLPRSGERALRAEEFFNEIEALDYPVRELPHLRAALGRFDSEDAVLVLIVHHVAADGWSMRLILRDLAHAYAVRRGLPVPDLPATRQYREYAALPVEDAADARAYWKGKLRGAELATVEADFPPTGEPAIYACHRFMIDGATTAAAARLARSLRATPFMIMMTAYSVLLREETGRDDVVAGSFSAGRTLEDFRETVGPFLNFLPLRTDLSGCRSFRQAAERVRTTCVEAYTNDIPFDLIEREAPGLMDGAAEPGREILAFEVLQFPSALDGGAPVGDLVYEELRERTLSQEVSCDIPDGGLWALDPVPGGGLAGSLKFDSRMFDPDRMWAMTRAFERILRAGATAPDEPLPPTEKVATPTR